jgi:cysteine desulfurase
MRRIYLDHAATTPLAPEALEAMLPWLEDEYGNPSSLHADGRSAKDAIDEAREVVSGALGCLFAEVVFTGSGTEAANLAILGAALHNKDRSRSRILLGAAEHHCVLHTQPLLERFGYCVELIPVDREARVSPSALASLLGDDVLLVSVMHANNELGSLNTVRPLADLAHGVGALMHTDAVQTFGRPWRVDDLDADLVSISAHKINGPKGVGALYLRAGVKLQPLIVGGGQEREMRAGTENVAGIAGFGAAVRLRGKRKLAQDDGRSSQEQARDAFVAELVSHGFVPTLSSFDEVLPGHAHLRLPGVDAETMLIRLDRMELSASSGAACSSGSLEPSHVLLACGYSERESREGLRFTFPIDADLAEAEEAAERVIEAADGIRRHR